MRVREHLGIDLEGGTEPKNYERALEGNWQFGTEMSRQAEKGQADVDWHNGPYKNDDDDSMSLRENNKTSISRCDGKKYSSVLDSP